jgi:hypothetical protein
MSNIVTYIHNASEEYESKLLEVGRPNTFISNLVPTKAEWDFVQDSCYTSASPWALANKV